MLLGRSLYKEVECIIHLYFFLSSLFIFHYRKLGIDLCDEEVQPGQQVDPDKTEDKQIIDLWLDRPQERVHGSQGQELPRTTERRGNKITEILEEI